MSGFALVQSNLQRVSSKPRPMAKAVQPVGHLHWDHHRVHHQPRSAGVGQRHELPSCEFECLSGHSPNLSVGESRVLGRGPCSAPDPESHLSTSTATPESHPKEPVHPWQCGYFCQSRGRKPASACFVVRPRCWWAQGCN